MYRRSIAIAVALLSVSAVIAAEPVTVENFVRAESDTTIRKVLAAHDLGEFVHTRSPAPVDDQPVIRMNRDTLYSTAVLDLSKPATVTLPESDGRYQSLHVISQDHYMFAVSGPGNYKLIEDEVGTRFGYLIVRTFADPGNADDVVAANAVQDGVAVTGGGDGPFVAPEWNQEQLKTARMALNELAKLGANPERAFGRRGETDPVQHLVYAAAGWGGLPQENAFYVVSRVAKDDGTPHVLNVANVPTDGFWSVTVYNSDGYLEPNPVNVYSFNNVTAESNEDGSFTLHFGGCEDGRINCIPIMPGWNYAARMYEPRAEILDGSWTFPVPQPLE